MYTTYRGHARSGDEERGEGLVELAEKSKNQIDICIYMYIDRYIHIYI